MSSPLRTKFKAPLFMLYHWCLLRPSGKKLLTLKSTIFFTLWSILLSLFFYFFQLHKLLPSINTCVTFDQPYIVFLNHGLIYPIYFKCHLTGWVELKFPTPVQLLFQRWYSSYHQKFFKLGHHILVCINYTSWTPHSQSHKPMLPPPTMWFYNAVFPNPSETTYLS